MSKWTSLCEILKTANEAKALAEQALGLGGTGIVVDGKPTEGSKNAVSSGGVYDAIDSLAIKGNKSGSAVACDVSPIEHTLKVKARGENLTTAKILRYGKNIVNIPFIDSSLGAYFQSTIPCYITVPITISGAKDNLVIQNASGATVNVWRIRVEYKSGKVAYIDDSEFPSKTFEATESDPIVGFTYRNVNIVNGQYKDIQVECNETATKFEPFIEPVTYPISADGTVEGIMSLYPTTTLIADTEGIVLDVEYNRDINRAFAELQSIVNTLIGG